MLIKSISAIILSAAFLTAAVSAHAEITTQAVFESINQQRIENGLAPLRLNDKLNLAAEQKAEAIIKNQKLEHNLPKMSFFEQVSRCGYHFEKLGENLALEFNDAEHLADQWMISSSHRANILNKDFLETGIAVKTGNIGGIPTNVVVQYYAAPEENPTEIPPLKAAAGTAVAVAAAIGLTAAGLRKYF